MNNSLNKEFEAPSAHSKLGASSYYRWGKSQGGCPGSVKLSEGISSPESPYAKEGTHAHNFAAQELEILIFDKKPKSYLAASAEMKDAVQVYIDFVLDEKRRASLNHIEPLVLIEHRFDLSSVYPGMFGTADCVIYDGFHKKLIVADYKHGAGIAVEVENNSQLKYYALGALLSIGKPCAVVEVVVVQPRCEIGGGPIRRSTFQSVDLFDFIADLELDAKETENPQALLVPGTHCRFCPAAAAKCPAIKDKAQALAKLQFKPQLSYDPEKLDQALSFLPALEAWITQVREFAYGEAIHGRTPPGWKLVAKRTTRKWTSNEEDIVEYMSLATKKPIQEFYETPSIKSPSQMEKLCSKQIGEGLRAMMESVSSGYNLVPDSDKREAVKLDPKTQFTQISSDST